MFQTMYQPYFLHFFTLFVGHIYDKRKKNKTYLEKLIQPQFFNISHCNVLHIFVYCDGTSISHHILVGHNIACKNVKIFNLHEKRVNSLCQIFPQNQKKSSQNNSHIYVVSCLKKYTRTSVSSKLSQKLKIGQFK